MIQRGKADMNPTRFTPSPSVSLKGRAFAGSILLLLIRDVHVFKRRGNWMTRGEILYIWVSFLSFVGFYKCYQSSSSRGLRVFGNHLVFRNGFPLVAAMTFPLISARGIGP